MKRNAFAGTLAALALAVVLGGCATGPVSYDVRGQADPVLNRDVNGKSLSVVVRLYQLKQPSEFSKLTFDMLASGRPESELLGQELIDKSEVVVVPGTQHVSTEKLSEQANYLGVVAFFRQPDTQFWRYLVPANQVRSKGVTFRLHDCYITLVDTKPEPIPGQRLDAKAECPATTTAAPNIKAAPTAASATPATPAQTAATENPQSNKKPSTAKRAYKTSKNALKQMLETPAPTPVSMPNAAPITAPAKPVPVQPGAAPSQAINIQFTR